MEKLFYETDDFEIYCFCPISDNKMKETDYFFVGGFDSLKKKEQLNYLKYYLEPQYGEQKLNSCKTLILNIMKNLRVFKGLLIV